MTVPNAARMYDYALGGFHNFAVDREVADQIEQLVPGAKLNAHANRAFVNRVVRWLVGQGIQQFLDVGSGVPTVGNVHEIAQSAAPDARVMYVDIDPVAIAHSRAILATAAHTRVIQGDLVRPTEVLYHPEVLDLLDFSRPIAVLLNAVLHFVPDADDPEGILGHIYDAVVRGSYVTITHGIPIPEADFRDKQDSLSELYRRTPTSLHLRSPERIRELLAPWNIVEPGIVSVSDWHADPDDIQPPALGLVAVVARKS